MSAARKMTEVKAASAPPPKGSATAPAARTVSTQLVTLTNPAGGESEAIRALRTHVMAQHLSFGRRALAVCAASAGVGCTFVAANLAIALSQVGVSTLLIDADLREPGLDKLLPPGRSQPGLAQFLSNPEIAVGDCLDQDALPNLSVMYAGGATSNAQELLASDRFGALMNACLRDFDATIVDTAPANRFADARRVSTVVGYSLLVARRHHTFAKDLRVLTAQLQADHARVIGSVLNEA
jgi:capsular exopolysaccharide synthesis family protein